MVKVDYSNDQSQDERLDPYSDNARDLYRQEQSAYDREFGDIANGYGKTGDDSQENAHIAKTKNIDATKAREQAGGGWTNNFSGGSTGKQSLTSRLKGFRKKGPMGAIIGVLVGGGGIFGMLLTPGIGIVQLKEVLTKDLNDQVAAMDVRTMHVFRAKLKSLKAGGAICSKGVKIRCKFTTMSKRQIQRFRNAGFEVETERTKPFGRQRITSMTARDGTKINDPGDLNRLARENVAIRSDLRRVFNPKFVGLSDSIAKKVFHRWNTDKTRKVSGNTDEERDKSVTNATAGEKVGLSPDGYRTDEDGRNYVYDENGNKVYESGEGSDPDKFKEISEEKAENLKGIQEKVDESRAGSRAVGGMFKSLGKGFSLTGGLDTACTMYNLARAVSAAAKITRAMQLVQFFMVFAVTADRIKAGDAEPKEVEYVGEKLAAVDTQKTVTNEDSIKSISQEGEITTEAVPNPHYGENAYDSEGYEAAAYDDAPILPASALQFAVGGALSGKLASVLDKIVDKIGGRENVRSTCHIVQSWWARTAGLVAGIVSAAGSFGATFFISAGASLLVGFAQPFLEAALADIVAGNVVNADTEGVDAGNAAFAGGGALLGSMAQHRGMQPASAEEFEDYSLVAQRVQNSYVAVETYEARDTPFDVMNQYSFLGSAVRKINPAVMQSSASVSAALINIPSILGTAFASIVPHANADQTFNPERFSRCNDEGYRELGIDADVFCNPRYYMSDRALNMPTEEALNWMLEHDHITDDGEPKSDEYKDWLKNCVNRTAGWGETESDDNVGDADIGLYCVDDEHKERNMYFGVFYMDLGISEAMDNGVTDENDGAGTTEATGDWINPAGGASYDISSKFGPRVLNGELDKHKGVDLKIAEGTDFVAACSGTIKSVGHYGHYSGHSPTNVITIDCGSGITTKYMHYYTEDLASGTKVGEHVSAGTVLAKVGEQGHAFGAHLHFQVEQNGHPIDPMTFMKKMGVQL